MSRLLSLLIVLALTVPSLAADVVRTAQSGPWSAAATWENGQVPGEGARVLIRAGHDVTYDVQSDTSIRFVHIAGTLAFAPDKDTRLVTGLIRIEASEDAREDGFNCDTDAHAEHAHGPKPALLVGTPEKPIAADHKAEIKLAIMDGQDPQSFPAIVCCAARMEFHGAPLSRTWLKLGATAIKGATEVVLEEPVTGWRVGDRLIVTATELGRDNGQGTELLQTEERTITAIDGAKLTLDKPLAHEHLGLGEFRGEVANLSRNVIVESADPSSKDTRGHTMYHRHSAGSISYAEFKNLGKEGVLGRYSLHFHLIGNTMRGSSIIGASIHGSGNRWLTIHGTNYLVVRDCVGYQSIGHGFFLEDGTEVYNVLDRNLAVQAMEGQRLPRQVLAFDQNDGAGFWWANSLNTFTRNVTCENNRYGYRFEATAGSRSPLEFNVLQPDGSEKVVDVRRLPFVRFEDNEAHCDGLYGFNLGEGVNRVGPDEQHPFIVRNMKIWEIHYAFRPQSPSLLVENLHIHNSIYGVYHPNYDGHVYRNVRITRSGNSGDAEPFNRGHDDDSVQHGTLTVDGLVFSGHRNSGMPLIQMTDHNPTGKAESHFRNVQVIERRDNDRRALANLGGGPRPQPNTPTSVPVYFHDHYGPGKHAKVVSTKSGDYKSGNGSGFREDKPLTGDESRVAEVSGVSFPQLLDPVDDLPPATVITHISRQSDGTLLVRGTASDNGTISRVVVGGQSAKAAAPNFAQWEIVLPAGDGSAKSLLAHADDSAGNVEQLRHDVELDEARTARTAHSGH
jgi:hypothetical protein